MRQLRYDRKRLLDSAARALAKGRIQKAVELYRWVLSVEPHNTQLHQKIAPLLARTGQCFDAWTSFHAAARGHLRDKDFDKALAVYRVAARHLPHRIEAWQCIARLASQRGRSADAVEALLEGRRHFRFHSQRQEAVALLRRAHELAPERPEIALDLARMLARTRQQGEAYMLLEGLASRSRGRTLRSVRGTQWRIWPTLRHTWWWIRDAWAAGRGDEAPIGADRRSPTALRVG